MALAEVEGAGAAQAVVAAKKVAAAAEATTEEKWESVWMVASCVSAAILPDNGFA